MPQEARSPVMATFQSSPIVQTICGSTSGLTFRRRSGAGIVSCKPHHNPPKSIDQSYRQLCTAWFNATWKSQDPAYRLAWSTYASMHPVKNRFGRDSYLSGYQAAFQYAMQLFSLGEVYYGWQVTWPVPLSTAMTPQPVFIPQASAGSPWPTVEVNIVLPPGPGASAVAFWVATALSETNRHPRTWRYLGYDVSTGGSLDISILFENAEVQLRAGETIAIKCICDSGYLTLVSVPNTRFCVVS